MLGRVAVKPLRSGQIRFALPFPQQTAQELKPRCKTLADDVPPFPNHVPLEASDRAAVQHFLCAKVRGQIIVEILPDDILCIQIRSGHDFLG